MTELIEFVKVMGIVIGLLCGVLLVPVFLLYLDNLYKHQDEEDDVDI